MELAEHELNRYLMANACMSEEEKHKLILAYHTIDTEDLGLCSSAEAILSARTYKAARDMITFPEETVVVDCGCCTGLQQVFFNDCYKYIGIDIQNVFFKISNNSEFIQGDLLDIIPKFQLEPNKRYYAISVLCGDVWSNIGKVIKEKFSKVIIV